MFRTILFTVSGTIALAIGTLALAFPRALLTSKGVTITPAVVVWVREVGVQIVSLGVVALTVRSEPDSPAMRAILVGNALVQLGLFPIELLAWRDGTITKPGGVIPNSVLHLVLGAAFSSLAWTVS